MKKRNNMIGPAHLASVFIFQSRPITCLILGAQDPYHLLATLSLYKPLTPEVRIPVYHQLNFTISLYS